LAVAARNGTVMGLAPARLEGDRPGRAGLVAALLALPLAGQFGGGAAGPLLAG